MKALEKPPGNSEDERVRGRRIQMIHDALAAVFYLEMGCRIQLQTYGRYLSPSSLVMRPDAISHMREISGPMNLKVPRSVF